MSILAEIRERFGVRRESLPVLKMRGFEFYFRVVHGGDVDWANDHASLSTITGASRERTIQQLLAMSAIVKIVGPSGAAVPPWREFLPEQRAEALKAEIEKAEADMYNPPAAVRRAAAVGFREFATSTEGMGHGFISEITEFYFGEVDPAGFSRGITQYQCSACSTFEAMAARTNPYHCRNCGKEMTTGIVIREEPGADPGKAPSPSPSSEPSETTRS